MEFTVPDTLVLKIIEKYHENKKTDTILYILYDTRTKRYVIRGSRESSLRNESFVSYSFECESTRDLADFIEFVIDSENDVSYILYNYDNLPLTSNEITFDFLYENDDATYEVAGYDNRKLKRNQLLSNLRILKNIFNYNN